MCNDIDCFCYDSHEDCEKREAKWIAELTELRAVLAAAGIAKVDGVWTARCDRMEDAYEGRIDGYTYCNNGDMGGDPCKGCHGTGRIPIPNLAPVAGGEHD